MNMSKQLCLCLAVMVCLQMPPAGLAESVSVSVLSDDDLPVVQAVQYENPDDDPTGGFRPVDSFEAAEENDDFVSGFADEIGSEGSQTVVPTDAPTSAPADTPTAELTAAPTAAPTVIPTTAPTAEPTVVPPEEPTEAPTEAPSAVPTTAPTVEPTVAPTEEPTMVPTAVPTVTATVAPMDTVAPTATAAPSETPVPEDTAAPVVTADPLETPAASVEPGETVSPDVSAEPAPDASASPSPEGSPEPTVEASMEPGLESTLEPTVEPTLEPQPEEISRPQKAEIRRKPYAGWYGVVPSDERGMPIPMVFQTDYPDTVCYIRGLARSVSSSGCGATSLSMIIAYLTGNTEQNPYTLFCNAFDEGRYFGEGWSHETLSHYAEQYGVQNEWIRNDGDKIIEALKDGKPVIAHMGKGIFTSRGHYIVLRGVTEDGKILVNDPVSKYKCEKAFPIQTLLTQARNNTAFMICWTDEEPVVVAEIEPADEV